MVRIKTWAIIPNSYTGKPHPEYGIKYTPAPAGDFNGILLIGQHFSKGLPYFNGAVHAQHYYQLLDHTVYQEYISNEKIMRGYQAMLDRIAKSYFTVDDNHIQMLRFIHVCLDKGYAIHTSY